MARASRRRRAGFSLIEALVVLAITSLLLVLVFGVAAGARRSGFSIARRAAVQSEAAIGAESLRVLLQGVRLPQRDRWPGDFIGEPDALTAYVVPGRGTVCPVTGGAPLRLRIERGDRSSRLVCETTDGRSAEVMDLGAGPAHFGYALAGRSWTDRLAARLPPPRTGSSASTSAPTPALWVRLSTGDGREILEAVEPPAVAGARGG